MKAYTITFRSVTFAQRGEARMKKGGYRCTLQRTPRWMEEQGCGYALVLWTKDIGPALQALEEDAIPIRRVYVRGQDGQLEEVAV